jgi:hypothetical protein
MEDVQLEIIDTTLSERLEEGNIFANISNLNENLSTRVKGLEATELVQDGPSKELAATLQEPVELEEELQIEKSRFAKLARRLHKCKSEPETMEDTDISWLWLQQDMVVYQVKNLSSGKSSLESELRMFKHIIQ